MTEEFVALPGHHLSVMLAETKQIGNILQCDTLQGRWCVALT